MHGLSSSEWSTWWNRLEIYLHLWFEPRSPAWESDPLSIMPRTLQQNEIIDAWVRLPKIETTPEITAWILFPFICYSHSVTGNSFWKWFWRLPLGHPQRWEFYCSNYKMNVRDSLHEILAALMDEGLHCFCLTSTWLKKISKFQNGYKH